MKKKMLSLLIIITFIISLFPINKLNNAYAGGNIPAFPGAEGAGMYTTGGRGGSVYEVTNLNDSGPGSLRDGVKQSNVTIVFRVSGTIHLKSTLDITGSNITIAGQTAPGDGICIADYGAKISGSNIIIRYIRFRPGSANISAEPDALTGTNSSSSNIIVDHCSTSWSVDETLSIYAVSNLTVQWTIAAESLTMSGHFKGRHGYGGIWGGYNATWHHNLFANHTSRLPRVNVGSGTIPEARVEFINNVIYNWGFNNTYGGENCYVNLINNYYKPGPGTQDDVKGRIANPTPTSNYKTYWYINGNVLEGNESVTNNNDLGVFPDSSGNYNKLNSEVDIQGTISITDAQTAYNQVLAKVGATYPKRDAVDARIINEVKNGLGRFVNTELEVGGYPILEQTQAPIDSDHDGMPDSYEIANNLNPQDASDRNGDLDNDGYTNLEEYLNSIINFNNSPTNPEVKIINPEYNALIDEKSALKIEATAYAFGGAKIQKVEFYDNGVKLGEDYSYPYSWTIGDVAEGTHYLTAVAYDSNGLSTQATAVRIFANGKNIKAPWKVTDIGNPPIRTTSSLTQDGILTVKASGKLGSTADSFGFVYRKVNGDSEITAKIEFIEKVDHNALSGLMIRSTLDNDSPTAFIAKSYVKADKFTVPTAVRFISRTTKGATLPDTSDVTATMPNVVVNVDVNWVKLKKTGTVIEASYSLDGENWTKIGSTQIDIGDEYYIGFAADAAKVSNQINNYNIAKFSNISLVTQNNFMEIYQPEIIYTNDNKVVISGNATMDCSVNITNSTNSYNDTKSISQGEFELTIPLAEGINNITIIANTAVGNTQIQRAFVVNYERKAPQINLTKKPGNTVLDSAYVVELMSDEDCSLSVTQNDMLIYSNVQINANSFKAIPINFEKGRNIVKFSLTDLYGNVSEYVLDVIYLAQYDIVVDKNYQGNDGDVLNGAKVYKTVQAAINSIPSNNTKRTIILIKKGTYKEKITMNKPNVSFIGEDPYTTILTYDDAADTPKPDGTGTWGTSGSASVTITAANFTAENITFENSFDEINTTYANKQAVAVKSQADMLIFKNCRFIGNQDTLYADQGRQYFKDCYIEGDVDFIFGAAQAVFENCTIFSVDRPGITPKGYVTAASTRNTDNYGYLFINCKLLSNVSVANSVYLGRPWHPSGALDRWVNVVFRECYLGEHIKTEGWTSMSSSGIVFYPENERFYEYKNYGPGAVINQYRPQLTDVLAEVYTKQDVLGNWDADWVIDTLYNPIKINVFNDNYDTTTKINYTVTLTADTNCNITIKHGNQIVNQINNYTANSNISQTLTLSDGLNTVLIIADNGTDIVEKVFYVNFINYAPEITIIQSPPSTTKLSSITIKGKINKNGLLTFKNNGIVLKIFIELEEKQTKIGESSDH